jgi:hypothetical protein
MSTSEERKIDFPLSTPPPVYSSFFASTPVEIKAKFETINDYTLPDNLDLFSLDPLGRHEDSCLGAVEFQPDWAGPDGSKISGLELSLKDELFVAAHQQTALSVYPVPYINSSRSLTQ